MRTRLLIALVCAVSFGCGESPSTTDAQPSADEAEVMAEHGVRLDELPEVKLVLISPHNTDIESEYELHLRQFVEPHAVLRHHLGFVG